MLIDIENKNPWAGDETTRPEAVYSTKDSAGFDIPAADSATLPPGEVVVVRTGLFLKQPKRFRFWWFVRKALKFFGIVPMLEIRPRSGLAVKGITVNNAPGTIDADYPQEIMVILTNRSSKTWSALRKERIAQGVVTLAFRAGGDVFVKQAERTGGLGSTGK